MPNYSQPVNELVRDMTRALIRKNNNLNAIVINSRFIDHSLHRPSWLPNWLGSELPEEAYYLASEETPSPLPRGTGSGQENSEQVSGVIIGTIARISTVLELKEFSKSTSQTIMPRSSGSSDLGGTPYYQSNLDILDAL